MESESYFKVGMESGIFRVVICRLEGYYFRVGMDSGIFQGGNLQAEGGNLQAGRVLFQSGNGIWNFQGGNLQAGRVIFQSGNGIWNLLIFAWQCIACGKQWRSLLLFIRWIVDGCAATQSNSIFCLQWR